jgi:hypothetical protein
VSKFVNTGAYVSGSRPRTKKALREAVASAPQTVTFDSTAALGPGAGRTFSASDPEDIGTAVLVVTGPDPYTKRNWYANVTVAGLGEHTHLVVK